MKFLHVLTPLLALLLGGCATGGGQPQAAAKYRCIFNHELLIVCGNKTNSPAYMASFIDKLKDTDVDAVMCCPTAWRANLFPSEVDPQWRKYTPEQKSSKFPSFDYIMKYIHDGGDPVKETLAACRRNGKAFFISYRMNDHHYVTDLTWPTHNAFWREHPQYWLGDTEDSPYTFSDKCRLLNYLVPEVREYYFSILRELCTRYDVDGLELDFQRFPKFFHKAQAAEGRRVMTAFVERIRALADHVGRECGKTLPICVRVPETLALCDEAGLDVMDWDARGLIQMINISSSYVHTMNLGLEEFKARRTQARLYGEMNYVTYQAPKTAKGFGRRYTTFEVYRATALNFFARGADGLSLFNYDYVPAKLRPVMAPGLKGITDVEFLRTVSKDYTVYPRSGLLPATNNKTLKILIPDDTRKVAFARAALRVETRHDSTKVKLGVRVNGKELAPCEWPDTELFPPVERNEACAPRDCVKFFAVPLEALIAGENTIEIARQDSGKASCSLFSMELALMK
ncbi:MAG: hypothetical protein NTY53_10875 [Kiritimatiellaeota bacterium]|nr:hypothetical protein [Kiritimatiellota bacterium]